MSDYFKRVSALTPTRFWVNNVTPEQAREGIAAGAVGCTQNPSYLDKMFSARPEHCRDMAKKYIGQYDSDTEVLIQLAHIAGIYDECLGNYAKANAIDISPDVLWHAGIAVAKKVHAIITERRYPVKFLGGGAPAPLHRNGGRERHRDHQLERRRRRSPQGKPGRRPAMAHADARAGK